MKTYCINLKSHILQAWPILIHVLIVAIVPIFFKVNYGSDSVEFAVKLSITWFCLPLIPQIVIHIKYYLLNKKSVLNFCGDKISYEDEHLSVTFTQKNISEVSICMPNVIKNNSVPWFPWQSYYFSRFKLNTGEEFIVTTLLLPNLMWPFELEMSKFNIRSSIFCWPSN